MPHNENGKHHIWTQIARKISKEPATFDAETLEEWKNEQETNARVLQIIESIWHSHSDQTDHTQAKRSYEYTRGRIRQIASRQRFRIGHILKIAASVLVILSLTFLTQYFVRNEFLTDTKYHQIYGPEGNRSSLLLPDGSKVWLNKDSKLLFPEKFENDCRQVTLKGEGFFEVESSTERPFIVHTSHLDVKVTGTKFNVSAYENENKIETTLISGKVEVIPVASNKSSYLLEPGMSMTYTKNEASVKIREVDTKFYTYWTQGQFTFHDETFEGLARRLKRLYNIEIVFESEEIKQQRFSGTFYIDDNIYTLMELFKKTSTVPIEYKKERNVFIIKPLRQ